jgi:hypothetical protein
MARKVWKEYMGFEAWGRNKTEATKKAQEMAEAFIKDARKGPKYILLDGAVIIVFRNVSAGHTSS